MPDVPGAVCPEMLPATPYLTVPMPSRENVQAKARRYLLEGRLRIDKIGFGQIHATCRGNGEIYPLGYAEGHWWCACPMRGTCSHLVALQLVTTRPDG